MKKSTANTRGISSFLTSVFAVSVLLSPLTLHAATLTWDNGNGDGHWDTTTANWTGATWNNATPDEAIFNGSGLGTVTIYVDITAAGVTFNANGYTLDRNDAKVFNLGVLSTPFTVNDSYIATSSLVIAGTNGLNKLGSGTLVLTGASTYSGTTTISAGTIVAGAGKKNTTIGTGPLVFDGPGATLKIADDVTGAARTYTMNQTGIIDTNGFTLTKTSGTIAGTGGLTKLGSGTLDLHTTNTYTGTTTILGGTLSINGGAALVDTAAVVLADTAGVTFALDANETIGSLSGGGTTGGTVALGNRALTISDGQDTTYAGVITGANSGTLVKQGPNMLTLSGTSSYQGATYINGGTISIDRRENLGNTLSSKYLYFANGGTLKTTNTITFYTRLMSLGTGGGVFNVVDGTTLTTGADNGINPPGYILGTGSLTKTGNGTMILEGANTYSGTTTIYGGELQVNSTLAAASNVQVDGGALSGTGTFAGTVDLANTAGSAIQGGAGAGDSRVLNTGAITFGGSNAKLRVYSDGTLASQVDSDGAVVMNGMTVDVLDPLPAGSYDILASNVSVTGSATIGTNNSGHALLLATTTKELILRVADVPSSPQTVTGDAGNATTTLSWTAPASNGGSVITAYRVYRDSVLVSTRASTTLSYADSSLSNGTTYEYYVTAVSAFGESLTSSVVSLTPVLPGTAPTRSTSHTKVSGSHPMNAPVSPRATSVQECKPYLDDYVRPNSTNGVKNVEKLQFFLNEYEGEALSVDGIYSQEDIAAVKRFQLKHKADILDYWNLASPNGYVFVSTRNAINRVYCERTKAISCPYFTETAAGKKLSASEILRIRGFLASVEQEHIKVDSLDFDAELTDAIKRFQTKYADEILWPWKLSTATGNWYQSTRKMANTLVGCPYPVRLDNGQVLP